MNTIVQYDGTSIWGYVFMVIINANTLWLTSQSHVTAVIIPRMMRLFDIVIGVSFMAARAGGSSL